MAKFTVDPAGGPVVVRAGGAVIAETTNALILREDGHDPVYYLPRSDAGLEFMDPSETRTVCPDKGTATHFHIAAKSGRIENAAWSYEDPIAGAEAIAGYVAFYPDKATVERL